MKLDFDQQNFGIDTETINLANAFAYQLGTGELINQKRINKILKQVSEKLEANDGYYPFAEFIDYSGPEHYAVLHVWPELWDVYDINLPKAAAEHYVLESLATNAITDLSLIPKPKTVEEIRKAANILGVPESKVEVAIENARYLEEISPTRSFKAYSETADAKYRALVERLAPVFSAYTQAAVGGELRHVALIGTMNGVRKQSWIAWQQVCEKFGSEALYYAAIIFMSYSGGGAVGGRPWAEAAYVVAQYLDGAFSYDPFINKAIFVDRVISMQHNCGSLLNKMEWGARDGFKQQKKMTHSSIFTALDQILLCHSQDVPAFSGLSDFVGPSVRELLDSYIRLVKTYNLPMYVSAPHVEPDKHVNLNFFVKHKVQEPLKYVPGPPIDKPKLTGKIKWDEVDPSAYDYLYEADDDSSLIAEATEPPTKLMSSTKEPKKALLHTVSAVGEGPNFDEAMKAETYASKDALIKQEYQVNGSSIYYEDPFYTANKIDTADKLLGILQTILPSDAGNTLRLEWTNAVNGLYTKSIVDDLVIFTGPHSGALLVKSTITQKCVNNDILGYVKEMYAKYGLTTFFPY